jgi:N-acetylglucosaminyldiphosphoundecaprenol N-acetyl-beta-D-mannosaminyltransferase
MKINIAGVLIDDITKTDAIQKIDDFVTSGKSHYIVTPYSEMIVFAQRDEKYKQALNAADLSLPDGIGIVFAAKYLGFKIHERVTGRLLVFDIAKLCQDKNYSLALVGGTNNVAKRASAELKKQFPNLKINLAVSDKPFDQSIVGEINASNSDILLIAYSPPKQELWLADNIQKLNVKVAIGLGGTFDYLAGIKSVPPIIFHKLGLEWLWRLLTQPTRMKRMWNAVPVFSTIIYKYKRNQFHEKN